MRDINFGWLIVLVSSPGSLYRNWSYETFVRRLGVAATPGEGECGPCRDFVSITLAFALQTRKM